MKGAVGRKCQFACGGHSSGVAASGPSPVCRADFAGSRNYAAVQQTWSNNHLSERAKGRRVLKRPSRDRQGPAEPQRYCSATATIGTGLPISLARFVLWRGGPERTAEICFSENGRVWRVVIFVVSASTRSPYIWPRNCVHR